MFFVIGTRNRIEDRDSGHFYCPNCKSESQYVRKQLQQYITFMFIRMTPGDVLSLFGDALALVVLVVMVLVVPSLLVGLVVSVFQAATQINEQTLSFLPRLIATLLSVMAAGPWMMTELMELFQRLFQQIPTLIG